jgi:hypothetical protein
MLNYKNIINPTIVVEVMDTTGVWESQALSNVEKGRLHKK